MEWEHKEQLEHNKIEKMKHERSEYEKQILLIEALKKKTKTPTPKNRKSILKQKFEIEPPIVTENTVVDIRDEFSAIEQKSYEEMLSSLNPNKLHLEFFEVSKSN